MKLETIMWLLPVAFMIHDFEEIVFMKSWARKKESYLLGRVPRFAKPFILHIKQLSTAAFALGVAEEFLMLSLAVYICVEYENYSLFAALTIGYLFHIIVHLMQGIYLRTYVPAIGTGVVTGIYNCYALWVLQQRNLIDWGYVGIALPIVIAVIFVNIAVLHYLAGKFDKYFV